MFTEKLGLVADGEISAKMDLINSRGEIVRDDKGEAGWIEFYGPDAQAVKNFRRQVEKDQIIEMHKEKRRGNKAPNEADAERELDRIYGLLADGLAKRTKDWRLLDAEGKDVKVPCTFENAKELFGHPDYEFLRREAQKFCEDQENFFTTNAGN